jgi:magnesium-protoporphyrin IX monomethyl ester (oxidative) cyclase
MRVLLVNPPSPASMRVSRGLMGGFGMAVNENLVYPPLNLAYVAAVLRQAGHPVSILDADALGLDRAAVFARAGEERWDLVGVDSSTTTIEGDLSLAAELAKALGARSFAIGAQVSHTSDRVLNGTGIDFVIRDEPEDTVLELVGRLERKESLDTVQGLSFRRDGAVVHTEPRTRIVELDRLPLPARDLLPNDRYRIPDMLGPMTTVQSSRGCPINCTYCGYTLSQGLRFRYRSAANVLAELVEIVRTYGVKNVVFRDPLFSANKRRIHEICEGIGREKLEFEWQCETALKCLDEELLAAMRKAGCVSISFGVETATPELGQKYSNSKIKSEDWAKTVIDAARRLGIRTRGFFMLGFPEETRPQMRRTVSMAVHLNPDSAQFTAVTPYPGTPMWHEMKDAAPDDFVNFDGHTPPEGVNQHLSSEELTQEIKRAYRRFYLRPKRLLRDFGSPRRFAARIRHYLALHAAAD